MDDIRLPVGTVAIVCGSRKCAGDDRRRVFGMLDRLMPDFVIQGGAPGVDRAARDWAQSMQVHMAQVDPIWDKHGMAAGPLRNRWMLKLRPNLVIAFSGGRGTADMCRAAVAAGIQVMRV